MIITLTPDGGLEFRALAREQWMHRERTETTVPQGLLERIPRTLIPMDTLS